METDLNRCAGVHLKSNPVSPPRSFAYLSNHMPRIALNLFVTLPRTLFQDYSRPGSCYFRLWMVLQYCHITVFCVYYAFLQYRAFLEATLPILIDHRSSSQKIRSIINMAAPALAPSTREMTHGMIVSNELSASQMAEATDCHVRTIKRHRSNVRLFGSVTAPANKDGRPRSISPLMVLVLCDHLLEKAHMYLDEMAVFL